MLTTPEGEPTVPKGRNDQFVAGAAEGKVKLVYIAGCGRSGSTLLDTILGAQTDVFSCGELTNFLRSIGSPDEYCACGIRAGKCDFWLDVRQRWRDSVSGFAEHEYASLQKHFEAPATQFISGLKRLRSSARFGRYCEYATALYRAVADVSGSSTIVDSSKSPTRAFALSAMPGLDILLVHLVRDLRGVTWSLMKSYKKSPFDGVQHDLPAQGSFRSALSWARINSLCDRVRSRASVRSILVRYEDYVANPETELSDIAQFIGVRSMSVDRALGPETMSRRRHQISGNRLRMKPIQRLAIDDTWQHHLSGRKRKWLYILGWSLMRRYGYRM